MALEERGTETATRACFMLLMQHVVPSPNVATSPVVVLRATFQLIVYVPGIELSPYPVLTMTTVPADLRREGRHIGPGSSMLH